MSQSALFTPRSARVPGQSPPAMAKERLIRLSPASKARRPLLAAGCVMVVIGSAAIVAGAFAHVRGNAEVLVARRAIAPGAVIYESDLTTASISGSGAISALPASAESRILGRTSSVALVAGQVIPKGVTSQAQPVPQGQAVVGMSLSLDQLPAGGVTPGDDVEVVVVSPPGSPAVGGATSSAGTGGNPFAGALPGPGVLPGPGSVIVASALVIKATPPPPNSASSWAADVSLQVPSPMASDIVTLAAAKQIGLALVPASVPANPVSTP